MEDEIIQDETQEQQTQDNQIPDDASADDLTLEEIVNTNDDDFEAYQKGEITAAAVREKYHFPSPEVEEPEQSSSEEETPVANNSPEDTEPSINYEEAWKKVAAPFKANGKMYQPQSADDVVNLMQKGVNYTQKMQQIAPMRKTFETLNKNKIDDNELNFLIDLHNGNKDAIKELLKRNKYEANSFEDAFGTDTNNKPYVPRNNFATDQEVQLSEILAETQSNNAQISDIVLNKWDQGSRDLISKEPGLLRALNEEINLGRFDAIQAQVENAKMFGQLQGVPDLQIYAQFARMYEDAQRAENQRVTQQQVQQQQQQVANANAVSKRAAAPSGRAVKSGKGKQYSPDDILNMSEEEFNKIDLDKLLAR